MSLLERQPRKAFIIGWCPSCDGLCDKDEYDATKGKTSINASVRGNKIGEYKCQCGLVASQMSVLIDT